MKGRQDALNRRRDRAAEGRRESPPHREEKPSLREDGLESLGAAMTAWVVHLIGGGGAFLIGAGLVLAALTVGMRAPAWRQRLAIAAAWIGAFLIGITAVPTMPVPLEIPAALSLAFWTRRTLRPPVDPQNGSPNEALTAPPRRLRASTLATGFIVTWVAGAELSWQWMPPTPSSAVGLTPTTPMAILGDSIAAGET
jgi:hypothetical protein